ncbi:MAG TPA: hypothetical protein VFD56_12900 [Chitinophagaceae bacterium]|nr:hypothetical protein [Chitinophagaceae bacterium]
MKKTFLPGLFLAVAMTQMINAQSSTDTSKFKLPAEKIISASNNKMNFDSAVWNEIKTNAIRNFTRDYKNVSNAKWYISGNGFFVVFFASEDISTWVYYNKKGDYERMIRSYKEEKLTAEVRHLVKSTYYDFTIYYVTEVNTDKKIEYHIKMADKTSWKTIKVVDGEMEITEEYRKAQN